MRVCRGIGFRFSDIEEKSLICRYWSRLDRVIPSAGSEDLVLIGLFQLPIYYTCGNLKKLSEFVVVSCDARRTERLFQYSHLDGLRQSAHEGILSLISLKTTEVVRPVLLLNVVARGFMSSSSLMLERITHERLFFYTMMMHTANKSVDI